jgi:hypothetical protein
MEPPRLSQNTIQFLQNLNKSIHSISREKLNNSKIPFQVFLLTLTGGDGHATLQRTCKAVVRPTPSVVIKLSIYYFKHLIRFGMQLISNVSFVRCSSHLPISCNLTLFSSALQSFKRNVACCFSIWTSLED